MSQADLDIDSEFDALLTDQGMEVDIDAILGQANTDTSPADAAVKLDVKPGSGAQEAQQPAVTCTKPSLTGKKRQLLVPQGSNKRKSVQVMTNSGMSDGTALSPKNPSNSPAADPSTTVDKLACSPPASAASSPAKTIAPPAATTTEEDDTKVAADVEMADADQGQEADEAREGEPEVQSPLKKAAAPEADDEQEEEKMEEAPATNQEESAAAGVAAAASGGAASSKAMAAGKRKGLSVAKAATGPASADAMPSTAPKAAPAKSKAPKAEAAKSSNTASARTSSDAAQGRKLPRSQSAFFFFSAEKRPGLKETHPGLSMGEYSKKMGELWKELSEGDKKPYHDMADADKERVAAEIAAMDPAEVEDIKKAEADARAAKKEKKADKADKAAGKASKAQAAEEAKNTKQSGKAAVKDALQAEKAAAKAEEAAKKEAVKAEKADASKKQKAEAVKKQKAAFKVFQTSMYASTKADNSDMSPAEVMGVILKAWDALEQSDKDKYHKMAEEAEEAAAAAKAAKTSKGAKAAGKRGNTASKTRTNADESEDEECGAGAAADGRGSRRRGASAAADGDSEDESDREDVDWEDNPALGIFCHDSTAYLVAREGLMMSDYGKVDTRKAKERLLHGGAGSSSSADELPVSNEQVEEYGMYVQRFWTAVKSRMQKTDLDMDELEDGSPLEMCYVLAKLQEEGGLLDPKAKLPKGDLDVRRPLPVMRLAMVVQRFVELERRQKHAAVAEQQRLRESLSKVLDAVGSMGGDKLRQCDAVAAAAAMLENI